MKRVIFGCLAAATLTACIPEPIVKVSDGITQHGETISLTGTKALTVAANAYAGAANVATDMVAAGMFNNDQLRMIRTLNNQAKNLLEGANTGLTAAQRAASLLLIVTQLNSITGKEAA